MARCNHPSPLAILFVRLALAIALPAIASSQAAHLPLRFRADNIGIGEGFHLNFIRDFCTDGKGMVWACGLNGLARFSGAAFKQYYEADSIHRTGLGQGGFLALDLDAEQHLWTAGPSGVYCYDEVRDSFCLTASPGAEGWKPMPRFIAFSPDKKHLWMLDAEGLWQKNMPHGVWEHLPLSKASKPEMLLVTRSGRLFFSVEDYSVLYDPVRQTVLSVCHGALYAFEAPDGAIYFGTWRRGLRRIDPLHFTEEVYFPPGDYQLGVYGEVFQGLGMAPAITDGNLLWCCTLDSGIWFFDIQKKKFVHHLDWDEKGASGLPDFAAGPMYVDRGGVAWLAMSGITRIAPHRQQLLSQKVYGLKAQDSREFTIRNALPDRHRPGFLWLAVSYYGLVSYDLKHQKPEKWWFYPPQSKVLKRERNYLADIAYDREGKLWASTEDGFLIVDKKRRARSLTIEGFNNRVTHVNDFVFDENNTCWMGTGLGLCAFDPKTGWLTAHENRESPLANDIQDMVSDRAGFWLATANGLVFFDKKTRTFRSFFIEAPPSETESFNHLRGLLQTRAGGIFALNEKGIARFENGQLRQLCYLPNMDFTHIRSLAEDDQGFLWLKAFGELFKINPQTGAVMARFECYGSYFVPTPYGNLLLTDHFFTTFNPATLRRFNYTQPPVITSLKIYEQPLRISLDSASTKPVLLDWRQNALSFEYDCPDFTSGANSTYEVMLEGYEKHWKPQGRKRSITYTNLAPGNYVFRLRVANMEGEKYPEDAVIRFRIRPPFWQTAWFKFLAISLLALVVYSILQSRMARFRQEERRRTELHRFKAETEMRALRAQMNPHFIFNCLNTIEAFIVEQKEEEATSALQKFSKLIRAVLENAQHDCISLSQELEVLEWYIQLEQIRANHRWDYQLEVAAELDLAMRKVPPLVLQPFVENAIVHGLHHRRAAGGALRIQLAADDSGGLIVIISDNGIGRDAAGKRHRVNAQKSSLGLQFTSERIAKLNLPGQSRFGVQITDLHPEQEGMRGTRVELRLP